MLMQMQMQLKMTMHLSFGHYHINQLRQNYQQGAQREKYETKL